MKYRQIRHFALRNRGRKVLLQKRQIETAEPVNPAINSSIAVKGQKYVAETGYCCRSDVELVVSLSEEDCNRGIGVRAGNRNLEGNTYAIAD